MSGRRVQIVVVAYHEPESLDRCLAAIGHGDPVLVVDNSSSSEIARVAAGHRAEYIDSGANVGFAAAVNLALERLSRQRSTSDVLLVNPDARIAAKDVGRLCAWLHDGGHERIAAAAPRLIDGDGAEQRVSWPFPSPLRMWLECVGLGRLRGARRFVIGAVLLLRREALDELGGFDERFFLYAEEADWQRRAYAAGWRSAVCPAVVAHHDGAGSSTDARRRETLFHAAQETYVRKWYGSGGWLVYRAAVCVGAVVRTLALRGERRAAAARRGLLYLRGPRRAAARNG